MQAEGDDPAGNDPASSVWAELYPQLKQMAVARAYRAGKLTLLDPTGLVNDAYLRMVAAGIVSGGPSGRFLAYAARTMRSIVIDLARERAAERHGGAAQRLTLDTAIMDGVAAGQEPLEVDQALRQLAEVEPRLAAVVEMRYFGGFTEREIGGALGVTERTVRRDWEKARLLLKAMLSG